MSSTIYSTPQLKLFAHQLTLRASSDSMDRMAGALLDAQVDLNPHQIDAALFATSNPLSKGAILADEVGLGKTIEAGLLLAQKWAERKRKLLIICPANLRKQWFQELADKFGLPSEILESKSFKQREKEGAINPFESEKIVITSYQFAASKAAFISNNSWDLVVADEAHRLRNVYKTDRASLVYETRLEDYLVRELINYDDVSYDHHAELINQLAGQVVSHFKNYLKTEDEMHNVLGYYGREIAANIHTQMLAHYFEEVAEVEVIVSQGFTSLKPSAITAIGEILTLEQLPVEKSKLAQAVYGGFSKCAYSYQKFHSDTERIFASILERDAQVWFRPVAGQFNIFYRSGVYESEYVPDFVATTETFNLIIETKKLMDMNNDDVKAKASAAIAWCENASNYSLANGGKPWKYCLISHDKVNIAMTLDHLTK